VQGLLVAEAKTAALTVPEQPRAKRGGGQHAHARHLRAALSFTADAFSLGNPQLNNSKLPPRLTSPLQSAAEQRAERLASGKVVIVCGGRDYMDRDAVFSSLDKVHAKAPVTLLAHGTLGPCAPHIWVP